MDLAKYYQSACPRAILHLLKRNFSHFRWHHLQFKAAWRQFHTFRRPNSPEPTDLCLMRTIFYLVVSFCLRLPPVWRLDVALCTSFRKLCSGKIVDCLVWTEMDMIPAGYRYRHTWLLFTSNSSPLAAQNRNFPASAVLCISFRSALDPNCALASRIFPMKLFSSLQFVFFSLSPQLPLYLLFDSNAISTCNNWFCCCCFSRLHRIPMKHSNLQKNASNATYLDVRKVRREEKTRENKSTLHKIPWTRPVEKSNVT